MIKSFKHKELKNLFLNNDHTPVNPEHVPRIARILDRLDVSTNPQDMNLPGYKWHELSGKEKGTWSVWVNGNRRIAFQFDGTDAVLVDYRDYH